MKKLTLVLLLTLAACNTASVYERHYRVYGNLHPELLAQQRDECRSFGYQEGSRQMSDCQMQLSQDWKRNYDWRPDAPRSQASGDCGFSLFGLPMNCANKNKQR